MSVVLDASALLALLLDEPGGEVVKPVLDGSMIGAVNLAEVVSHYAKFGATHAQISTMLQPLPFTVLPADAALSYVAGMLRPVTLKGGLSLGDRYCLALAKREGVPAMTAERRWPDIAAAAGVDIIVIR